VIGIRETIELGQQIEMVKVRAAMKDEHGAASTDVSRVQLSGSDSYAAFVCGSLPLFWSDIPCLSDHEHGQARPYDGLC
jgi:hypothetical protein